MTDPEHLARSVARLIQSRDRLLADLRRLGLAPLDTRANFFLLPTPAAAETWRALLERGILVRDCTNYGLPQHIRIGVRRPEDNQRLVRALAALDAHVLR